MITTPSRLRRSGAGAAIAALVGSGLLLAPAAHAADKVIPGNLVDQSETRATGHNVFGDDGVRVYTEGNTSTDKAAGYFDVDSSLAAAGEPGMAWSSNGAALNPNNLRPGKQLVVDFDDDGAVDGILVGEPVKADGSELYGTVWWLNNAATPAAKALAPRTGGGYGSNWFGTLDEWRAAAADAQVLQLGWSLGSGVKGDGSINSMTLGGDEFYFVKGGETVTKVLYDSDVDPEDTRPAGHSDFRPTSGIRVYTDNNTSQAKADGYFDVDQALATAGEPKMSFRTLSGTIPPGLQLDIDFDGDGTEDGRLVGEPKAYGATWWLTNASGQDIKDRAPRTGGGSGSNWFGLLSEWRAEFPDAQIEQAGYSLGSGVLGDYIIDSITVGLTKHTFTGANRAPVATDLTATSPVGVDKTVTLAATDADGDALTYSVASGGTVSGDDLTVTVPRSSIATRTVTYTVTDSRGATDTGTVTVTPTKASTAVTFVLSPAKPKPGQAVTAKATVTSTASVTNGFVDMYVSGKKLASGKVTQDGKVSIALGKAVKGTRTVVATFRGTSLTTASESAPTRIINK